MRYPMAGVLYTGAAVAWTGAAGLLITQLEGVTVAPLATFSAVVAMTVTTPAWYLWMINRNSARSAADADLEPEPDQDVTVNLVRPRDLVAAAAVYRGRSAVAGAGPDQVWWDAYADVTETVLGPLDDDPEAS